MRIVKTNKEKLLHLLLVFFFFDYNIQRALGYLGNRLPIKIPNFGDYSFYIIVIVMVFALGSSLIPKERKRFVFIIFYIIFILLYYYYTLLVSPKSLEIDISGFSMGRLMTYFLVILFAFMHDIDYELLLRWIVNAARILSPVVFLTYFVAYSRQGFAYSGYDMVLGYQAAICAIVLIYSLISVSGIKLLRFVDIVELAAMIAVSLFGGSRGSILTVIVYVMLLVFKNIIIHKTIYTKILYLLLSALIIYLLLKYGAELLAAISSILKRLNINSRTIDLLSSKDILNDSNRNTKYEICLDSWNNMPLFGYGLLGDRQFLNGSYVHNIFLEIITDFGFVLGFIIIIYILLGYLKCFKEGHIYSFLLIVGSYELTHLMVSGSFLTSTLFFILLGVLFSLTTKTQSADTTEVT